MITLSSLQIGLPKTIPDPAGEWVSGIWKHPVDGSVFATRTGLDGDGQADLAVHGGPDKAIYAYPLAHYPFWQAELGVAELPPGSFGENFTLTGPAEDDVCIGDVLRVGDQLVIQVSQPRGPCWKLARRLEVKDMVARVVNSGYTGWYYRVIEEGHAAAGMPLALLERPYPELTVRRANQAMWKEEGSVEWARRLVDCPALAESWRKGLLYRLKSAKEE